MKKAQLWKNVLSDLEISLSKSNFMTWIKPSDLVSIQEVGVGRQIIEIACPSAYHRQFLEERYTGQIKEVLDRVTKLNNEPVFVVKANLNQNLGRADDGPLFQVKVPLSVSGNQYYETALQVRLREDFTFDTFAVSSSNEMAYTAAQAVAKSPGKAYNPLYIYGGVGVGKTHLIQAIAHIVFKDKPETGLIYCTGEEFTNEIIEAIRRKQTHQFKKKYRSAKLLLIDDVQFIAGKTTVQEEFFHTFNAIQQEGGQIVLASDQPPDEIDGLEARLRSRFEGGLTIDIQQPNFELRTAILLIKAKALNLSLNMEAAQLIAANIESARRLEGFLTRLATEIKLKNQSLSMELVQALLGKTGESNSETKPITRPKEVLKIISAHFNLKSPLLQGPRRLKTLVLPRHLAMYFLRVELQLPLEEIGEIFGGRDHTTVMHAVDKVTKKLSFSEDLRLELANIRRKIYS